VGLRHRSPATPPLLDYRSLPWKRVRLTRYFCYQRFHYRYPGAIRHLRQQLMVMPPDRLPGQTLVESDLMIAPYPGAASEKIDVFGNRVWQVDVKWADREIAFETTMTVERTASELETLVPAAEAQRFVRPTHLTAADERILEIAGELKQRATSSEELAGSINDWVASTMQYRSGVTGVATTAAEALATGAGLCQDYAHIMLAICRAAGLPARYISGHMLAEGGSHAWVDVLLPRHHEAGGQDGAHSNGAMLRASGFDPTNRRIPDLCYTVVAYGRDYRDVAPASGSYTAPFSGTLAFGKRAGLLLAELDDGTVVAPDSRDEPDFSIR
jgi:transglutaminase-like putative cysteine protease